MPALALTMPATFRHGEASRGARRRLFASIGVDCDPEFADWDSRGAPCCYAPRMRLSAARAAVAGPAQEPAPRAPSCRWTVPRHRRLIALSGFPGDVDMRWPPATLPLPTSLPPPRGCSRPLHLSCSAGMQGGELVGRRSRSRCAPGRRWPPIRCSSSRRKTSRRTRRGSASRRAMCSVTSAGRSCSRPSSTSRRRTRWPLCSPTCRRRSRTRSRLRAAAAWRSSSARAACQPFRRPRA